MNVVYFTRVEKNFHLAQVYSVGVGLNRIQFETNKVRAMEELKTIAQTEENFFVAEEFDQLGQILHEVTQIACERLCAGFEQEL